MKPHLPVPRSESGACSGPLKEPWHPALSSTDARTLLEGGDECFHSLKKLLLFYERREQTLMLERNMDL